MGVFIHPCKIKERVCGLVSNEEFDALYEEYDALNEDILVLENTSEYDDFISPFEEGVYTYDGGQSHIGISYSTYGDFLQVLDALANVVDTSYAFSTTISASGIDNCVSYKVAERMLEEFKQMEAKAEKYLVKDGSDEYGKFLWNIYKRYMEVLQECIEIKGIVQYK